MPQVSLVRKQRNRRRAKLAAAIAVAVVVLVAAILWARFEASVQKQKSVVEQENQLDAAHNYTAEARLLSDYTNSGPPQRYQYAVLVRLGDLAYNAQQYTAAANWYFRAYRTGGSKPDVHVLTHLAVASTKLGDKKNAIAYWKLAVAATPRSDSADTNHYLDDISALEKEQ